MRADRVPVISFLLQLKLFVSSQDTWQVLEQECSKTMPVAIDTLTWLYM